MSLARERVAGVRSFAESTRPENGIGADQCVLFLHGLGGNSSIFYPIQEQIGHRLTTVSLDLLGLGMSAGVVPRRFEDWSAEASAVIAGAGAFGRISVVAHSLGTLIARTLAAVDPRVNELVLFGPITAPDPRQAPIFAARAKVASEGGMSPVADGFGVRNLGTAALSPPSTAAGYVRSLLMAQVPASYAACSNLLAEAVEPTPPANEDCRTLLVHGAEDQISTVEVVERVQLALAPTTTTVTRLPRVGHWPTLEAPSTSTGLALDFLMAKASIH